MTKKERTTRNVFFTALLAGVGLYFSRLSAATESLSYNVVGFRFTGINLAQVETELSLEIFNPSGSTLRMDSFAATVSHRGNTLSDIDIQEQVEINPRSRRVVRIPVPINNLNLGFILADLIKNRVLDDVKILGTVRLNGGSYPVDTKLSLTE